MELMKKFGGADVKIKAKLTIYADRSFDLELWNPVTSNLILWKLGLKSGSWEPNKTKIGKITRKDLEEIAELKRGDMNSDNIESMIKSIAGTARNMGIEVQL